jgi:ribosome maturation factor RimP
MQIRQTIQDIIQEKISSTQLFLVELAMHANRIDIYLDGDNGVNIKECAQVSKYLHRRLEEQGIDIGSYIVEVSSPGIDRNLSQLREFKKNVGRKLQVKNNQNKLIKGQLIYADAEKLLLATGSNKRELLEYIHIKEAKVVI